MKRFLLTAVICLVSVILFADCPTADLTGDCFVDLADLTVLAHQWLIESAECPFLDFTGDCFVNISDFSVFAQQWLMGVPPSNLVPIPGGTFQMGDSFGEGHAHELPVHTVTVDSFAIGKYEITNAQFCAFLNSDNLSRLKVVNGDVYAKSDMTNNFPYCATSLANSGSQITFSNNTFSVRTKGGRIMNNDPVVCVTWYGAVAFCNWRSRQDGYQECYDLSAWTWDFTKKGYRLPTEAEWEYAARGLLSGKRFPWGDTISHSQANYYSDGNYSYDISATFGCHPTWNDGILPYSSPVGCFPPNASGLYDMVGNVSEWCNDWYGDYNSNSQTNPTGPTTGIYYVSRGGSWFTNTLFCRVSSRYGGHPRSRSHSDGFRVVLKLD